MPVRLCHHALLLLLAGMQRASAQKRGAAVPMPATSATDRSDWNITRPLRFCVASTQNFGTNCRGAATPELSSDPGWKCSGSDTFCGYDFSAWERVAENLDLERGRDWVPQCMGSEFGTLIDSLAFDNVSAPQCDIAGSVITVTSERIQNGIEFGRSEYKATIAVLTLSSIRARGMWAFFEPLSAWVWMALLVTIFVIPLFVFFFESLFSSRCLYGVHKSGHRELVHGLKEALWHSISHTLAIDVFRVNSFPSRIVTIAYAFLVMILTNTYTANLAAFLTVSRLDTSINGISDLQGKRLLTIPTYEKRLWEEHNLQTIVNEDNDHAEMVRRLKIGDVDAVISDATVLIPMAYSDETCRVSPLADDLGTFDIAFAYRRGFADAHPGLLRAANHEMVVLSEEGYLAELEERYRGPKPTCQEDAESFNETNQVPLSALWGLWIILGTALVASLAAAAVLYLTRKPDARREMKDRSAVAAGLRSTSEALKQLPQRSASGNRWARAGSAAGLSTLSDRYSTTSGSNKGRPAASPPPGLQPQPKGRSMDPREQPTPWQRGRPHRSAPANTLDGPAAPQARVIFADVASAAVAARERGGSVFEGAPPPTPRVSAQLAHRELSDIREGSGHEHMLAAPEQSACEQADTAPTSVGSTANDEAGSVHLAMPPNAASRAIRRNSNSLLAREGGASDMPDTPPGASEVGSSNVWAARTSGCLADQWSALQQSAGSVGNAGQRQAADAARHPTLQQVARNALRSEHGAAPGQPELANSAEVAAQLRHMQQQLVRLEGLLTARQQ